MGVSTPNLPSSSTLYEIVGNERIDGQNRSVRATVAALGAQMLADGPLSTAINGLGAGLVVYTSLAALNADLGRDDGTGAWVVALIGSGFYRKSGASGSRFWAKVSELPGQIVVAVDGGLGTADAIRATTGYPITSSVLVRLTLSKTTTNTSVLISFNDDDPFTVVTSAGNAPTAGSLREGMTILGIIDGLYFRLLSDQASASVLSTAEMLISIVSGIFPIAEDSCGMWALKKALVAMGLYAQIRDVVGLPADPTDPNFGATIAWENGIPVKTGDVFHSWLKAALNYDDTQMTTLMNTARAQTL